MASTISHLAVWLLFFSVFSSASGIGLGTALLVVSGLLLFRARLRDFASLPQFWPIVAFVAATLLSVAFAEGTGFSKPLLKSKYFLTYFFLVLYFSGFPRSVERLAKTAVGLAGLLFVVALFQFIGVFCPMQALGIIPDAPDRLGSTGFFHARGLLYHHNPFGYTSTLLFHLLFAHWLTSKSSWRPAYFASAIGAMACVAMSASRGSWLALGLSVVVVSVWGFRRYRKQILQVAGVGAVFALLLGVGLRDRVQSIEPAQNIERLRLWEISWNIFRDYPWVGSGYHHGFELNREKHMTEAEKSNPLFPTDPHSLYFDLLATTGIVGVATFLWFIISVLMSYGGALRTASGSQLPMLVAGVGAWVAFLVGTAFDSHFYHTQTLAGTLFFLGLGQSACLKRTRR